MIESLRVSFGPLVSTLSHSSSLGSKARIILAVRFVETSRIGHHSRKIQRGCYCLGNHVTLLFTIRGHDETLKIRGGHYGSTLAVLRYPVHYPCSQITSYFVGADGVEFLLATFVVTNFDAFLEFFEFALFPFNPVNSFLQMSLIFSLAEKHLNQTVAGIDVLVSQIIS